MKSLPVLNHDNKPISFIHNRKYVCTTTSSIAHATKRTRGSLVAEQGAIQCKHIFGTTTAIERPNCNLTSVLINNITSLHAHTHTHNRPCLACILQRGVMVLLLINQKLTHTKKAPRIRITYTHKYPVRVATAL